MRTASITIDTSAFRYNLSQVRHLAPNSKVMAMVKADAYGHGLDNCIRALTLTDTSIDNTLSNHSDNHQGANAIGVATFEEAKLARLLGWSQPIVMIEGAFGLDEWRRCLAYEITCVVHQQTQVNWALHHIPDINSPSRTIWLKVNTGMNRLGFNPNEIMPIAKQLNDAGFHIVLISHFANADVKSHPLNHHQVLTFKQLLSLLHNEVNPNIEASLCNSAGIINFPDCHYDWVRPGIMLYGSSPITNVRAHELNLRPVMRFESKLMAIHNVNQGDCIGYGSTFTATYDMVKGIVSVGYGDGYPRINDNYDHQAWISLHHPNGSVYRCDIIGRVSMDMLAINLTEVPNPSINDKVVLWGDDTQGCPHVDDIAQSSGTISYELLCRLSQRPSRYVV